MMERLTFIRRTPAFSRLSATSSTRSSNSSSSSCISSSRVWGSGFAVSGVSTIVLGGSSMAAVAARGPVWGVLGVNLNP